MGQIRKIGDVYYIEFYARGLMYSQVAGADLREAEALLAKTEATIAGGEALTIVREIDLPVFFERYMAQAAAEFSLRSQQRFESLINHFQSFIKKDFPKINSLAQVTPSVVESYKLYLLQSLRGAKSKFNPKKVNLTLLMLREVLEYGIKIGFLNDNPSLHVRLLEIPNRRLPLTKRRSIATDLFNKGLTLGRVGQLLKISDVARLMYYAKLIPLSREEMYN